MRKINFNTQYASSSSGAATLFLLIIHSGKCVHWRACGIASRPSVRPSVRLLVTLMYRSSVVSVT